MSYYYLSSGIPPKHVTLPINTTSRHCTDKNAPCNIFDIHNHINLEITTVISGEVHIQLDNTDYLVKAGETVLANPFVLHSYTREKDCDDLEYITLTITLSSIFPYPNSELSVCASDLVETRFRFDEFYPAGHPISEYPLFLYMCIAALRLWCVSRYDALKPLSLILFSIKLISL